MISETFEALEMFHRKEEMKKATRARIRKRRSGCGHLP